MHTPSDLRGHLTSSLFLLAGFARGTFGQVRPCTQKGGYPVDDWVPALATGIVRTRWETGSYSWNMNVRAVHLVDVLVYLVVLGLFSQFFPAVISESFAYSLLTAVLLKVALELILKLKMTLLSRTRQTQATFMRTLNAVLLILVFPASKFVVLELVALVAGDSVRIGGFFHVTLLIVTLMTARAALRRLVTPEAVPGP